MISERISKVVNVRAKTELSPSDPRRLPAAIAKIPLPPTEEIPHAWRIKNNICVLIFFSVKHFLGVTLASLIEKILIVTIQLGNYCTKL